MRSKFCAGDVVSAPQVLQGTIFAARVNVNMLILVQPLVVLFTSLVFCGCSLQTVVDEIRTDDHDVLPIATYDPQLPDGHIDNKVAIKVEEVGKVGDTVLWCGIDLEGTSASTTDNNGDEAAAPAKKRRTAKAK